MILCLIIKKLNRLIYDNLCLFVRAKFVSFYAVLHILIKMVKYLYYIYILLGGESNKGAGQVISSLYFRSLINCCDSGRNLSIAPCTRSISFSLLMPPQSVCLSTFIKNNFVSKNLGIICMVNAQLLDGLKFLFTALFGISFLLLFVFKIIRSKSKELKASQFLHDP